MSVRRQLSRSMPSEGPAAGSPLAHKMSNDTIEEGGGNHTTLADAGCNGEPFRQVISDTNTAFTDGVEEL